MTRLLATFFLSLMIVVGPTVRAAPAPPPERELMEAAYEGELERVRVLVQQGVPVDTTDAESRTALMWASFNGHTEVVRFLLDSEAVVGARDTNGRTALMYASSGPFAATVALLLERGAEPK